MSATLFLSVLLGAAQAAAPAVVAESQEIGQREVAYEELSSGRTAEAVAELETRQRENPEDPATLINLGTAYAREGHAERAERAFRAAMASRTRYRLELADGSWVDSRTAARRGLETLERNSALASLDQ